MERPHALQEKVFQHLFEAAEIAKFDRKERYEYEESLKNLRDWYSVMKTAELKDQAIGHAKGRAEGQEESARHIALNLKRMGMPLADIVKATGLSESQIEDLSLMSLRG